MALVDGLGIFTVIGGAGQDQPWTRQFGTLKEDVAEDVAIDVAGNVYVVGWTVGPIAGGEVFGERDAYVRKYDREGRELWTRQFGSLGPDAATGIGLDGSGNLYVVGPTEGSLPGQVNLGQSDGYLRKYDGDGNEFWTRQFGTQLFDEARDIGVDVLGNLYVVGVTAGSLGGQQIFGRGDAYLRKYDSDGNELWTRQFGSQLLDEANNVAVDAAGNSYVSGIAWGPLRGQDHLGGRDGFVKAYDSNGNELWTHQIGTPGWDVATGVAVDDSGNVYVVGDTHETLPGQTNAGRFDAYLRKYDSAGSEVWTRQFGSQHFDLAWDVSVDADGNLYVVGWTRGTLPGQTHLGDYDAFVRMYDADGNQLRTHQFGGRQQEVASDIVLDALGNLYLAGFTEGALTGQLSSGRRDAFVLTRIHRRTGMDGVRTAEGGEGVTGAMIRARIWVDGRLAGGLQALLGAPMAAYSGCGERDGGIGHGKRRSRTGLARVCGDVGLAGGSVADGRRQAGSGMARSRARARLNCSSQGQRRGRCRVNRRAERVIRPAKAKTRRLRVLVVTIC